MQRVEPAADDVGHAITVRVTGSDGTVAEVSTGKVTAGSGKKALSDVQDKSLPETDAGFTAGLPEEIIPFTESGSKADIPEIIEKEPQPEKKASVSDDAGQTDPSFDDLPDFVRRTLDQGDTIVQPATPFDETEDI